MILKRIIIHICKNMFKINKNLFNFKQKKIHEENKEFKIKEILNLLNITKEFN